MSNRKSPSVTSQTAAMRQPVPGQPQQSALRTALAGLVGNILEWFDFAVYGYFASDIGRQFFPQEDPFMQQMLTYGTFAIGFFARPVGGLVLGRVGDRIGRRPLLTISILMMGVATLLLGLLPTYAQIGMAAPILLTIMRLIQGFSLGGEYTGSMAYTTEKASPMMRGIVSSSTAVGTTLGFILGSGSAWLVNAFMPKEIVATWGWRTPFIASVLICVAGYYILRGVGETEAGLKAKTFRPPLLSSLMADWLPSLQTFGIVGMTNAAYYLTFTFMVDRRKEMGGDQGADFLLANTLTLFVVLASKPLGGWLSDRIGRRRLMLMLTFATTVMVYFALRLMLYGTPAGFTLGQAMVGIPIGMALGLQGAMVVEIFPLRARVTSMSFAYSVTLALTGGMASFISTWLTKLLKQPLAPSFFVIALGIIGLAVMLPMEETNKRVLEE